MTIMKIFAAQLALLSCLVPVASGQGACFDEHSSNFFPKADWRYCQQLQPNIFMYYTTLEEQGNIMLGFHATSDTTGWTALAMAGNGGMKGASQIVVRKDDDGAWVAEDRHSMDYSTPIMDESQDVKLLFAEQTEQGETAWGVLMMINPCDEPNDYPVEDKSSYMHWAFGNDHTFSFHGKNRGQFHANFLRAPEVLPSADELDYIDFIMPDVPVVNVPEGLDPTNPYICGMFDLDQVFGGKYTSDDKVHAVRVSPFIDERSEKYVHHMILYECNFDEAADDDGIKLDADQLTHLQIIPQCESMPAGCWEMKYGWAVGGQDIIFPDDVGMPLGEGKRWLGLQMHYYNPQLDEGVTDASGIRAYITSDLREQDAGIMEFDSATSPYQHPPMPMGVSHYELPPLVIPSDCTASLWKAPVNVLGVFHHMHRHGEKMEILLERDGKNLGPLRKEHHYDFNHQTFEQSAIEQLIPGDQLTVKCSYDLSNAPENVTFGDLTQNEMCYGGVVYYPRIPEAYFHYYPPPANPSICSEPGTEQWANVSRCAQAFTTESVPTFLGEDWGDNNDMDAVTMCNSAFFESEIGVWYGNDMCPPSCLASKNCTKEEIAVHAQEEFCVRWCNDSNLSLYPDVSRTEPHDSAVWPCPREIFTAPEPVEPEVCQMVGDLTLQIPENAAGDRSDDEEEEGDTISGANNVLCWISGMFSVAVALVLSAAS